MRTGQRVQEMFIAEFTDETGWVRKGLTAYAPLSLSPAAQARSSASRCTPIFTGSFFKLVGESMPACMHAHLPSLRSRQISRIFKFCAALLPRAPCQTAAALRC